MLQLDDSGWVIDARRIASPNHDARPSGEAVRLLVIHAISLPPNRFGGHWIEDLFLNRLDPQADAYFASIHQLRVSAHFLIRRDGELLQFVSCNERAWHAGVSTWAGRERCNDFSIGVELEGCDEQAFEDVQYDTLNRLSRVLHVAYPIIDVVGHSDIAPGRKTDPGPFFTWSKVDAPCVRGAKIKKFLA